MEEFKYKRQVVAFFSCCINYSVRSKKAINKLKLDVSKLIRKIEFVKKKGTNVCACIKAEAYGIGMIKVAKCIEKVVDYFAVARLCELVKLRRAGIFKPTLILSPLLNEEVELAIRFGGEISVDSVDRLYHVQSVAIKLNKIAKVHIQIDTGMRRFGVTSLSEYLNMLNIIKNSTSVNLVGVYSHFYSSDYTRQAKQREIFERIILETHRKQLYPIFHISASSGAMEEKNMFDMVRLGICLYEQSVELESQVIAIKKLKKGEGLGYDHNFIANRDMLIAVVGIGYGDGIKRNYSSKGYVEILGNKMKIIGNICMDCLFVDLGQKSDIEIGESVKIFGNCLINICDIARDCDTITYEILTGITRRVKREFIYAGDHRSISRSKTSKCGAGN